MGFSVPAVGRVPVLVSSRFGGSVQCFVFREPAAPVVVKRREEPAPAPKSLAIVRATVATTFGHANRATRGRRVRSCTIVRPA